MTSKYTITVIGISLQKTIQTAKVKHTLR